MSRVDGYGKPFSDTWEVEHTTPIGLVPRNVWVTHRIQAIQGAIVRYTSAKRAIPLEWIEEYNELVSRGE